MAKRSGKRKDQSPRTRVVVDFEGRQRQLFSVGPSDEGTVYIYLNLAYERGMALDRPFKHVKHSLHQSKDSSDGGFNVVTTIITPDLKEERKYCYVAPNKPHANAVIATHIPGRLCSKAYDFKAHERDQLIQLTKMPYAEMLTYVLVCSKSGLKFSELETFGFKVTEISMGEFNIGVLYGFFPVPPMLGSLSGYATTVHPKSQKFIDLPIDEQIIGQGLSPAELSYELLTNLTNMSKLIYEMSFSDTFENQAKEDYANYDQYLKTYRNNTAFLMRAMFPHDYINLPSEFLAFHEDFVLRTDRKLSKKYKDMVEEMRSSTVKGSPNLELSKRMEYSVSRFRNQR